MAIIHNWLPPSRENWELVNSIWQLFPLVRRTWSFSCLREARVMV